jgi:uncharacterized protein
VKRLKVPPPAPGGGDAVREIGWAEFGDMAKDLAERIGRDYRPDVVLGVVNGGVFVGGVLAPALKAELHPLRVEKRGKRRTVPEPVGGVRGRTVLVVDDVIVSGVTMGAACKAAKRGGAREIRSATLVARPGRARPDYNALETNELVVFGWDYGLDQGGGGADEDPGEVGV